MVGSPYTSRGCANCKKRKIKCDLGKPQCARCIKKGYLCRGYDQNRNFLHHTVISRCTPSGKEIKRPVPQLVSHLKPLALPPMFDMSPEVRTQLFASFMDTFFAPKADINCKDDSWYFLMGQFPFLAGESELFDRSVIAFAATFLGKRRSDWHLERYGCDLYNNALNVMGGELRRNCQSPAHMIYATIVFHTYETIHGSDIAMRNCLTHIQGATAIMNQKSFEKHSVESLTKAMLVRQKWAAVLANIIQLTSLLAFFILNLKYTSDVDGACLTIGREDSPMDELFAMIAECAFLQRDVDKISQLPCPNKDEASCEALLQRSFRLVEKLETNWLNDGPPHKLGRKPSPCREKQNKTEGEVVPSMLLPPDYNPASPYKFENLSTAKAYLLLWIALAVTCRTIYQLERLFLGRSDPTRMLFYAGEICRSVAYCMQPGTFMSAVHIVLFAVSQASRCYIECEEREMFMWCQRIYPLIQARGIDLAVHISEEDWGLWSDRRV